MALTLSRLIETAGEHDALSFMFNLGEEFATSFDLGKPGTVEALQTVLNQIWGDLRWGWCELQAGEEHLSIIHGAWPGIDNSSSTYRRAISEVLRGAYSFWLAQLGEVNVRLDMLDDQDGTLTFVFL